VTTAHRPMDELAREGLAVRTVLELVPLQARVLVRLPADSRRLLIQEQLEHLASVDALTNEQARELVAIATSDRPTDAASTVDRDGGKSSPPTLTLFAILTAASAPPVTDSFVDDLFDLALTAFGALVGEIVGGPGGALAGGMIAHGWAEEHPPSTWFE
jgi:hypothetical protein